MDGRVDDGVATEKMSSDERTRAQGNGSRPCCVGNENGAHTSCVNSSVVDSLACEWAMMPADIASDCLDVNVENDDILGFELGCFEVMLLRQR